MLVKRLSFVAILNGHDIYQFQFDMVDSTDIVAKKQADMAAEIFAPQAIERGLEYVDFRHKFLHVPSWTSKSDFNIKGSFINSLLSIFFRKGQ